LLAIAISIPYFVSKSCMPCAEVFFQIPLYSNHAEVDCSVMRMRYAVNSQRQYMGSIMFDIPRPVFPEFFYFFIIFFNLSKIYT